jgi:hypothetical protein
MLSVKLVADSEDREAVRQINHQVAQKIVPRPDFSGDFDPASREIKQKRRPTCREPRRSARPISGQFVLDPNR